MQGFINNINIISPKLTGRLRKLIHFTISSFYIKSVYLCKHRPPLGKPIDIWGKPTKLNGNEGGNNTCIWCFRFTISSRYPIDSAISPLDIRGRNPTLWLVKLFFFSFFSSMLVDCNSLWFIHRFYIPSMVLAAYYHQVLLGRLLRVNEWTQSSHLIFA